MRTLEITKWNWSNDLTSFVVEWRIIDTDLKAAIGPKTDTYSNWDTTKTIDKTIADVQADLERRYI